MSAPAAVVYRFYDADDHLLYVGTTVHWATRLDAHRRKTAWFAEVARHEISIHATPEAAREEERALIAGTAPRYNIAPGGGGAFPTDPATHRIRATFTLSPAALRLVTTEARRTGESKSAIVERAIRDLIPAPR